MKTIAQQCREQPDPFQAAIDNQACKSMPSDHRKIFYFADGSYLAFKVSYEADDDGRSDPCAPPNTI